MTIIHTIDPERLLRSEEPAPALPEPEVDAVAESKGHPGVPSAKAQSWGTVISIVVIVLMIVIGAFYAWGERIAQNQQFIDAAKQNVQSGTGDTNL
jgi:hypothetical protein